MADSRQGRVIALPGKHEARIADDSFIAQGACVIGEVALGSESGVWYNAVLRADSDSITIGDRSNIQDGVAVHVDEGHPTLIGDDVSVGHNAVVHGCTVKDGALIGMGAVVLNGAVIGEQSLVAGGAVVLEGTTVPPRSLVAGVPARVRRELTDAEVADVAENAARYVQNARLHAGGQ